MKSRDYEEFAESLNASGARYLIIGAHAVAFHARPRATKDFDVFIGSFQSDFVKFREPMGASNAIP
jgi:hypothetical protein